MGKREQCGSRRIGRIERQCLPEQLDRLGKILVTSMVNPRQRTQIEVVGVEAFGRLSRGALDLRTTQLGFDRASNARCDLILQLENVVERAVEAVSPDMGSRRRVYQLPCDAHTVAG